MIKFNPRIYLILLNNLALGHTLSFIIESKLGVSKSTFNRWLKNNKRLQVVLEAGRELEEEYWIKILENR